MTGNVFIDTNILVYAHDEDAGPRHKNAQRLIEEVWQKPELPFISVQVLQEFFVNLYRLGIDSAQAWEIVSEYTTWQVVSNTPSLVGQGVEEMRRWNVSFWDGLILAASRKTGARILWSEDLSDGQDYDGIRVINPL